MLVLSDRPCYASKFYQMTHMDDGLKFHYYYCCYWAQKTVSNKEECFACACERGANAVSISAQGTCEIYNCSRPSFINGPTGTELYYHIMDDGIVILLHISLKGLSETESYYHIILLKILYAIKLPLCRDNFLCGLITMLEM